MLHIDIHKQLFLVLLLVFMISCTNNDSTLIGCPPYPPPLEEDNTPPPLDYEIIEIIRKVNDYWQYNNNHGNSFWNYAAYHTGNIAAYEITGEERYKKYSMDWAEKNQWEGARSNDKSEWEYQAGISGEHVLFGDYQACFQIYIDLYNLDKDEKKIARAKEVMSYQINTSNNDYWWWVDALYMVMPVMTKMYRLTNDIKYLDKLYDYFSYTKELLYDSNCKLFYRDTKFLYPKHKTQLGIKDFWSRGNGWAFAALVKILQDLPENSFYYKEFIQIYKDMASTLATFQQKEGFWTRSVLDVNQSIGYETSGTAFFVYGFLWGINTGILDQTYTSVINRGWKYLSNIALQESGLVGYVQPPGQSANDGDTLSFYSTEDFGVGAFLLAACEMYKYSCNYYGK